MHGWLVRAGRSHYSVVVCLAVCHDGWGQQQSSGQSLASSVKSLYLHCPFSVLALLVGPHKGILLVKNPTTVIPEVHLWKLVVTGKK